MCKLESSQKDENRAQSADFSKAYSKPRAFKMMCQNNDLSLILGSPWENTQNRRNDKTIFSPLHCFVFLRNK